MKVSRREMMRVARGVAGVAAFGSAATAQVPRDGVLPDFKVTNGRIRQSVMGWCFKPMPTLEASETLRRHWDS